MFKKRIQKEKMTKKIKKILTLNFGVGMTTCKKIHKQLGLNFRNSLLFIEKNTKIIPKKIY